MTLSVQEKIDLGDAVFKWVQHTPVGHLKDLSDDDLEMIRQQLIKEVRGRQSPALDRWDYQAQIH